MRQGLILAVMDRISEKHSFDNGRGQRLAAVLDRPVDEPRHWALFGPCFTCLKESHAAAKISRALAERGIAVLRFDTTGFGESEGHGPATHLSSRIADWTAAAHYLAAHFTAPRLLVGHSMSGTAALSAYKHIPSVDMIVTVGSPRDSQTTISRFTRDRLMTQDEAGTTVNVLGRPYVFENGFVEDMMAGTGEADTAAFTGTLLAAHAHSDEIVEFAEAEAIIARAAQARRAEVITLPDSAGHLFLKGNDAAAFLADAIVARL